MILRHSFGHLQSYTSRMAFVWLRMVQQFLRYFDFLDCMPSRHCSSSLLAGYNYYGRASGHCVLLLIWYNMYNMHTYVCIYYIYIYLYIYLYIYICAPFKVFFLLILYNLDVNLIFPQSFPLQISWKLDVHGKLVLSYRLKFKCLKD